ncbi:hypothetical protein B0A48_05972 [Cryoendolithus antarcticus]|uniref:YTH domain-containing protein n=1 Tax=Cryoendolithus antarcticus TaxID=1507870 RepID=A0A1V8TCV1_9PEZI|nr:hypothetical protein B0A48_05972 [Cryoendolithus antarcticus]
MQGLEDALPLTQPQQYLGQQHGNQHLASGGVDQYGRQTFYGNAQALNHPPQYSHHVQHPGLQPGHQHYGPQYAMPGQQYQRAMLPGMQHPQMFLPPVNPHAMHGGASAPVMPMEWRHSQASGRVGPYADISSMSHHQNAYGSPQASPGVFSAPRGPPRKPRQSGFALWVGNLPPAAGIADLKDHFSRDATKDIESLFLISKSNCAFVNYRTEATCSAAMHRFHDSRFNGTRLVCRLRKGASTTTSAAPPAQSSTPALVHSSLPDPEIDEVDTPTIVGGPPAAPQAQKAVVVSATALPKATRIPESFFILKSLTSQDLDASVRRGEWTTQVHNELGLNAAFERAENVYLVFSANKSGEYFGYARMLAPISGDLASAKSPVTSSEASPDDGPRSIPTPATATAPSGRIIDDSARGTLFWEADVAEEDGSPLKEQATNDLSAEQELGRPFRIEWISTGRLPFFRTRGLRNAWNANREVKIARDGTELEPVVGRKLMLLFHGVGF